MFKKRKPLLDMHVKRESCMPLEEGLNLMPEIKSVFNKVLGRHAFAELCRLKISGSDAGGERHLVEITLTAPDDAVVALLNALKDELGITASASRQGLLWTIMFTPPPP